MKLDLSDIAVVPHIDGDHWNFKVICYGVGRSLGAASCTLSNRTLNLDNIRVHKSFAYGKGPVLLMKLLGRTVDLRRRGIGTKLLRAIIGEATQHGLKSITASIMQEDFDENPFLLNWLTKHGFSVWEPDKDSRPDAVNKIHLRLPSRSEKKDVKRPKEKKPRPAPRS